MGFFVALGSLQTLIYVFKEIRIHYIVLSRPSQKREGFLYAMDPIVVFMGISKKMYGIDK